MLRRFHCKCTIPLEGWLQPPPKAGLILGRLGSERKEKYSRERIRRDIERSRDRQAKHDALHRDPEEDEVNSPDFTRMISASTRSASLRSRDPPGDTTTPSKKRPLSETERKNGKKFRSNVRIP